MGELDWIAGLAGAGFTGVGGLLAFRLLATVSDYTSKRYRDAASYSASRVDALEQDLLDIRAHVRVLAGDLNVQRQAKHDWRSFAGSLHQERYTIRRFAELHDCAEIIDLMDRLDAFRADSPLMTDVAAMTDRDLS